MRIGLPYKVFGWIALALLPLGAGGQSLEQSLDVVAATNDSAAASQRKIDALARETALLLEEYRSLKEQTDYQAAYARELEQLDAAQQAQIDSLTRQIDQARLTRQRILPLMRSMADALEKFVALDLPFHQPQRLAAVLQLKQRLERPDLTVAARFRLLLEAFQLEQDYGSSVESWRGPLQFEGESLSVEYLRLGRLAMYFQTLDRERSAYWDAASGRWQMLDPGHNRALERATRMARGELAPQLLELPLAATGGGL